MSVWSADTDPDDAIPVDAIYMGMTRDAKITVAGLPVGLPVVVWVVILLASIGVFLVMAVAGDPWALVKGGSLYIALHALCLAITVRDPKAFRLIGLWFKTVGHAALSRRFWGAAVFDAFGGPSVG